ncbi:ergosterol biosynthesis ERG4/ERG24 [Radiomyces spectabilis]|uniref:ergosterol biosynthesis ERG4/ERG24 n=1 Tax=Radiomyces spectabilis TaxID=64574 RepID=UPI0022212A6C|nr:ergosterol biosynthesis ERG4/ERG24 [Radiomyces spectabilis]KAI8390807.1 ergosterol biosynthesis ERG4/ERG24 [Radiomyces spectabilis]
MPQPKKHLSRRERKAVAEGDTSLANFHKEKKEKKNAPPPPRIIDWAAMNPKTSHYEFGGPIGAAAMVIFLPALVLLFAFGCDQTGYMPFERFYAGLGAVASGQLSFGNLVEYVKAWKPMSLLWYFCFIAQLVTFTIAMPGTNVEGTQLRDGTRLSYRINALQTLQTTTTMLIMSNRGHGWSMPLWVQANFAQLAVASVIFSFFISITMYICSFLGAPRLLALGGNTGNMIYDFMIGRELNPRIGDFDLKFFTELRPGLIGWLFLDGCMAVKQWVSLGRITNSMVLVLVFQAWYVLDALWNESSILTTMDITTDGFGFMLAFGNLCWVPMMYSLQTRYLSDFPVDLTYIQMAVIIALQLGGYYIFRSANKQKDVFRKNPEDERVRHLSYIETQAGTRLLTSGWWGKARHINYLGDWLMSVAWCLPCGFKSIIPYFYCIYFAILLIHRERRDDEKCRKKYGEDWETYCNKVKYRIIPGVY